MIRSSVLARDCAIILLRRPAHPAGCVAAERSTLEDAMDPTLAGVGAAVITEGIKFLYSRPLRPKSNRLQPVIDFRPKAQPPRQPRLLWTR